MLPSCEMACLYAPYSQGKSFVGLELAAAITQGRSFGGYETSKGRVLYLIGESPYGMQERFHSLIDVGKIDDTMIYVSRLAPQLADLDVRKQLDMELADWLGEDHLALVVVDTLAVHAIGIEENSSTHMGALMSYYRMLVARFSATVLFLHHAGKDALKGIRGSSAIPSNVSTIMFCEKVGEDITIECEKQRDAQDFTPIGFEMRPVNGSMVLDSVLATDNFNRIEQAILDAIVSSKDGIAATRDFFPLGGDVAPRVSMFRAINSLLNRKIIKKVTRGKYAKYQSTI